MQLSTTAVRLIRRAVVLAALTLVTSACTDGNASPLADEGSLAPVSSNPPVDSSPPIDGSATLLQGLTSLADGYSFHSIVTVDGVETLVADGDRLGDSSRLTLVNAAGTVAYIITPAGSYAQPEFGDWEALDVAPATSDPINALATPLAVAVVKNDAAGTVVRVTVSAVSLGIAHAGTADIDVTLINGFITRIAYATSLGASAAAVVSQVLPLVDTTPIVAPI